MSRDGVRRALLVGLVLVAGGCSSGFKERDGGAGSDAGADAQPDTGWKLVYSDKSPAAGESLNSLWVAGAGSVYAVGDNGQIVWLEKGQWISLNKTSGVQLYGVWGRSASDVYAVGTYALDQSAAISHYDGSSWRDLGPIPKTVTPLSDVWGTSSKLYFTSKDGTIFTDEATQPYHLAVKTGGCPDVNDPPPVLWAIDGSGPDNILAAGDTGLVGHRDASGWTRLCHPDVKVAYRAVFRVPGATTFYLGANYLGLWRFTGRTDAVLKIHEDRGTPGVDKKHLWSIWGPSEGRILAVGDGGTLLYFDGGSSGARKLPSPTTGALFGVGGVDARTVYICGEGNRIWQGALPSK